MTGPTLDNPAQENNLIVPFLNRDVVVLHTFTSLRQISQLMVVSCKQGLGCHLGIVVQVFSHGPGDTDAVKSGGSAADLIEDNQTAWGGMVEDVGGFCHLNHERRLPAGQVVTGANPGEYSINDADMCLFCGHQAADLRHQNKQRNLTHKS